MQITPYRLRPLVPPKDDLRAAIRESRLSLREGDIVAISSKVVSIGEGRCVPVESQSRRDLARREADWYLETPQGEYRKIFTISHSALASSAGVDESNGNGHYVLYPKDPDKSARALLAWFKKAYGIKKLGLVMTDSVSLPLRRGAIGFALAHAGFAPLKDYRGTKDVFGRAFKSEVANIADALAAAAVLAMGEGGEQTPVAVVRGAPVAIGARSREQFAMDPQNDLYAPLIFSGRPWKRGGGR